MLLRAVELASLPRGIIDAYKQRGVTTLFPWQRQCLQVDGVLRSQRSLVYVAPTSGGKSLIAEVLACRTLHLLRKKVLYVVPYVSMVREVGDRLASLFDKPCLLGPLAMGKDALTGMHGATRPPSVSTTSTTMR